MDTFRFDLFGSDSKLMELQNFSQPIVNSWFILVLISFCNLFMVDLDCERYCTAAWAYVFL